MPRISSLDSTPTRQCIVIAWEYPTLERIDNITDAIATVAKPDRRSTSVGSTALSIGFILPASHRHFVEYFGHKLYRFFALRKGKSLLVIASDIIVVIDDDLAGVEVPRKGDFIYRGPSHTILVLAAFFLGTSQARTIWVAGSIVGRTYHRSAMDAGPRTSRPGNRGAAPAQAT